MINLEIIAFIEHNKAAGMSDAEITRILCDEGGWKKADVREAFGIVSLPPGSIQAAQFRASQIRKDFNKKSRRKIYWKIALVVFLLGLVGGGVYFGTSSAEQQVYIVETITDTASSTSRYVNEQISKLMTKVTGGSRNVLSVGSTSSATSTSFSTNAFSLATSTPNTSVTSGTNIQQTISPTITQCGSFTYQSIDEANQTISSSTCFSENFKTCSPATMSVTVSGYTTVFTIQNSQAHTCLVKEEISGESLPNAQKLICSFDAEKKWADLQDTSSSVCKALVN